MLELKNDYLHVTAKRDDVNPEWLNVRIEITSRKPIELHRKTLKDMEQFMFDTFKEHFGNVYHAETATKILKDPDNLKRLDESTLPIVREYPLYIGDIYEDKKVEADLLVCDMMNPRNCGFLTEETLILTEVFAFIRANLTYIEFWECTDKDFWNWDDKAIWYCKHAPVLCSNCGQCKKENSANK